METVQQNGRFTLFSSKFHSNIYSILFVNIPQINRLNARGIFLQKNTKFIDFNVIMLIYIGNQFFHLSVRGEGGFICPNIIPLLIITSK